VIISAACDPQTSTTTQRFTGNSLKKGSCFTFYLIHTVKGCLGGTIGQR